MFVDNITLARDFAKPVRHKVGKKQTCDHLTSHEGWADEQVNEVDCNRLHSVLKNKWGGYKTWLKKNRRDSVEQESR